MRTGPGRPELSCVLGSFGTGGMVGAVPREAGTSWTRRVRLSGIHVNALGMTELTVMPFRLWILPDAVSIPR